MSTDPNEVKVTNIGDNNTGWLSRLFCATLITIGISAGAEEISDAIDKHTDAIEEQTKVLQEIHAPSAE